MDSNLPVVQSPTLIYWWRWMQCAWTALTWRWVTRFCSPNRPCSSWSTHVNRDRWFSNSKIRWTRRWCTWEYWSLYRRREHAWFLTGYLRPWYGSEILRVRLQSSLQYTKIVKHPKNLNWVVLPILRSLILHNNRQVKT
jgi:hypothetical protein